MVQRLETQELNNYPGAVVAIVSDHGFAPFEHDVSLAIPFIDDGLVQVGMSPYSTVVVTNWQAEPWAAGCVSPIMLHDPSGTAGLPSQLPDETGCSRYSRLMDTYPSRAVFLPRSR